MKWFLAVAILLATHAAEAKDPKEFVRFGEWEVGKKSLESGGLGRLVFVATNIGKVAIDNSVISSSKAYLSVLVVRSVFSKEPQYSLFFGVPQGCFGMEVSMSSLTAQSVTANFSCAFDQGEWSGYPAVLGYNARGTQTLVIMEQYLAKSLLKKMLASEKVSIVFGCKTGGLTPAVQFDLKGFRKALDAMRGSGKAKSGSKSG